MYKHSYQVSSDFQGLKIQMSNDNKAITYDKSDGSVLRCTLCTRGFPSTANLNVDQSELS